MTTPRQRQLHARSMMLARTLGDGPWLWAAAGRLNAATGLEPPAMPWYADAGDQTALSVAYWRERGRAGFYNRSWRKRPRYARHLLGGNDGP